MKKVNLAIIGFGFMGKVYTHAAKTLKDYFPDCVNVNLVALLVSENKSELEINLIKKRYGFKIITNDINHLLDNADIDAFYIASPNNLHFSQVQLAIQHNKHVLCDKPMGMNSEETKLMLDLANKNKKLVSNIVFQYRYLPAITEIKNMIDSNVLGEIIQFRFLYLHGSYIDPRPITWRLKKGTGGALVDLGPHIIDLVNFLLGDFKINFCKKKNKIINRDVDDAVWMLCETDNSADGYIELSRVSTGSLDDLRIEIHGVNGSVKWNLEDLNYFYFFEKNSKFSGYKKVPAFNNPNDNSDFPPPKVSSGWLKGHVNCLYHFVKEISDKKFNNPHVAKFEHGHFVQQKIDKLNYESN